MAMLLKIDGLIAPHAARYIFASCKGLTRLRPAAPREGKQPDLGLFIVPPAKPDTTTGFIADALPADSAKIPSRGYYPE